MTNQRLVIKCTLSSFLEFWVADIIQIDFCVLYMTDKVKIIWLSACSLPSLPLRLRQALLNSLTTSSPLTWREASRPPQVTHTHTDTRTATSCDWHCDAIVSKSELYLQYAARGPLTLHQSIFAWREWQLFRMLESMLSYGRIASPSVERCWWENVM